MKENSNKYSASNILKRIYDDLIRSRLKRIITVITLMVIASACTAGFAYLIKPAVDQTMFKNANKDDIWIIPAMIVGIALIKVISQYFYMLTMGNIQVSILNQLRKKMFSHFIHSDLSLFSSKSSGGMISNIVNDLNSVMALIALIATGAFVNFITATALFINMLYQNASLTFFAFICFPLAFYPIYLITRKIKKLVIKNQKSNERYFSMLDDSLSSIKVIKSYNAEKHEITRLARITDKIYRINRNINKVAVFPSPFMEGLTGIGAAFVIWYSGHQIADGNMTLGEFFSFFASLMMAYKPIKSLAGFNTQLQQHLAGVRRAFKILDRKPQIADSKNALDLTDCQGQIEFKNVSFSYESNEQIIDNISFNLEKGNKYALVGRSGAGKSTIFNLILRFFDSSSGSILIDGKDIKEIKLSSLRKNIAYVGQETHLFEGSVKDNIAYGNLDADIEDIIEAAKKANAHEFIEKLPRGYETRLGKSGGRLSGGQRQRISIARAILSDSPILLLDEATSALDVESEKLVQQALEDLMKNKTTLMIAHRLSTVINSDKIFVIDSGKVIESGSNDELLKDESSTYSKLYKTQFK